MSPAVNAFAPQPSATSASRRVLEDVFEPSTSTPAPGPALRQKRRTASWRSFVAPHTFAIVFTRRARASSATARSTSSEFIVVCATTPSGAAPPFAFAADTPCGPTNARPPASSTSPTIPLTSACAGSPRTHTSIPFSAKSRAERCTRATNGQVASTTLRSRRSASARTCGDTPWAEKTTVAPRGTSATRSTNLKPRSLSSPMTIPLWTSSCKQ